MEKSHSEENIHTPKTHNPHTPRKNHILTCSLRGAFVSVLGTGDGEGRLTFLRRDVPTQTAACSGRRRFATHDSCWELLRRALRAAHDAGDEADLPLDVVVHHILSLLHPAANKPAPYPLLPYFPDTFKIKHLQAAHGWGGNLTDEGTAKTRWREGYAKNAGEKAIAILPHFPFASTSRLRAIVH